MTAVEGALAIGFRFGEAPAEFMAYFPTQVAGGIGVTGYSGVVGRAPRTLVRDATQWIPSAAGSSAIFRLIRGITGAAAIAQQFASTNVNAAAPQAQCISGADASVLGGTQSTEIRGFDPNPPSGAFFIGPTFFELQAVFSSSVPNIGIYPIYLFPGDALVCFGVRPVTAAAQFKFAANIAEYTV